jgi:hypothetical protein
MPVAGLTATTIINQVMGRTEGRATNKGQFDPRFEFWTGIDEFCQEKHYWWRRKALSFQTQIGVQNYDLGLPSNSTAAGCSNPDCVEIEELFVVNALPVNWPYMVHPNFNASQQIASIYGGQSVQGMIPKNGYFFTPGSFQQLTLSAPPDAVYTVAGTYYAVPMVNDFGTDVIPLIPRQLHWGLVYVLERRVYEFLYSQNDPRFVTANARYEQFKVSAARIKSFSQQFAQHMKTTRPGVSASGGRGYGGYSSGSGTGNPPY